MVKESDAGTLKISFTALAPFILRRTKEQVLKDLPEKSEQVLYCELSPGEMRKYNEIEGLLLGSDQRTTRNKGLLRSKIDILEALLRFAPGRLSPRLLDKKLGNATRKVRNFCLR